MYGDSSSHGSSVGTEVGVGRGVLVDVGVEEGTGEGVGVGIESAPPAEQEEKMIVKNTAKPVREGNLFVFMPSTITRVPLRSTGHLDRVRISRIEVLIEVTKAPPRAYMPTAPMIQAAKRGRPTM